MDTIYFALDCLSEASGEQIVAWIAQAILVVTAQLGLILTRKTARGIGVMTLSCLRGTLTIIRGEPPPPPTPPSAALAAALEALEDDAAAVFDKRALHCTGLTVAFNPNDGVATAKIEDGTNLENILALGEWFTFCEAAKVKRAEVEERDRQTANVTAALAIRRKVAPERTKSPLSGMPHHAMNQKADK